LPQAHGKKVFCPTLEGGNKEVRRAVYHGGKAGGNHSQSCTMSRKWKESPSLPKSLLQGRKKRRWLRAESVSLLTELLALAVPEYKLQYSASKHFDSACENST